ncbi:hypothetical protein K466DRAFT_539156 [Polyporus arcularius HHB13444]|uniref:Uncharacterized protein n=1 Tax=Polyporus arcularius HHB13444 TaxID=1314778 RepID=A0A5C3PT29_9APHY|nr:hypothetical protein K466DRAFT_539156 [Polyporus arcularius HHB13444]
MASALSSHRLQPSAAALAVPERPSRPATRARAHSDTAQPPGDVRAAAALAARPVTAALATPHDAVLADLEGPRGGTQLQVPHAAPRLSVIPSVGSTDRGIDRTASPSAGARSAASTPGASHDPLLDPFSGNLAGVMVPRRTPEREAQFDQRRDELWSGLATIRELQSEVASMHVQMEGIGLNDVRGGKRTTGVAARVHSDPISAADEWEEHDGAADGVEEQRKRARDAEFTNLAETFKGRREAIDAIMNKLGELSDSLTQFHALQTPAMDFGASRNNTKDSMPLSPDLANATSPSTGASPSPELPSALPKFVLSEPDKGVMHESPVAGPGDLPHASAA